MSSKKILLLTSAILAATAASTGVAECNSQLRSNIELSRYHVLSDGTVKDQVTNLIWLRCPVGFSWSQTRASCEEDAGAKTAFTWKQALSYAAAVGDNWRMPNSKELESLVKRDCYNPAIEAAVFSDLELGYMWSSTPASAYFGNAWAIQFRNGGVVSVDKEGPYKVRLVKGAP